MKNVLITGTGSGIGKQLMLDFQINHKVISVSRKQSENTHHIICDLSIPDQYLKISEFIDLNSSLLPDIYIHNAATLINKALVHQTNTDISTQIQLNYLSPLMLTRDAIIRSPHKKTLHLYIGSMAGYQDSKKIPGLSVYSSTKAALMSLSQCLAVEYKYTEHRFISIALGATNTEMKPQVSDKEIDGMDIEYVSQAIKQLAEHGGSVLNGEIVRIDDYVL